MRFLSLSGMIAGFLLVGCGGSKEPAKDASDQEAPEAAEASSEGEDSAEAEDPGKEEEVAGIPTECTPKDDVCVPPKGWVDRLCKDSYPSVAIVMFEKSSPWTRGYMRINTEAINASGGVSGDSKFLLGEEVIVVRSRKQPKGGMQVTGAGGYDILRWDGTCATVSDGEMGLSEYGKVQAAEVTFRFLDESVREALRKNASVDEAYVNRRKHCKGATSGEVTKECEVWDKKLREAVVTAVRGGIELPTPEQVP